MSHSRIRTPEPCAWIGGDLGIDVRPLTPSLSPSDGERVPVRAGEGSYADSITRRRVANGRHDRVGKPAAAETAGSLQRHLYSRGRRARHLRATGRRNRRGVSQFARRRGEIARRRRHGAQGRYRGLMQASVRA